MRSRRIAQVAEIGVQPAFQQQRVNSLAVRVCRKRATSSAGSPRPNSSQSSSTGAPKLLSTLSSRRSPCTAAGAAAHSGRAASTARCPAVQPAHHIRQSQQAAARQAHLQRAREHSAPARSKNRRGSRGAG